MLTSPKNTDKTILPYSKLIVILISALAWAPSLLNGYALDDLIHISNNPALTSWQNLFESLTNPLFPGNLYRPLAVFSYGVIHILFNGDALAQHVMNITLHCGVALLLLSALRIYLPAKTALAITLLWSVLPIHSEVVANVTGRAELLSTLFGLATVLLSAKYFKKFWVLCFVFGIASILSKESGIIWIFLTLFLRRHHLSSWVLTGCIFAIYSTLRFTALGDLTLSAISTDITDNPLLLLQTPLQQLTAFSLLGSYAEKIFIPLNLAADYSYGSMFPPFTLSHIVCKASVVFLVSAFLILRTEARLGIIWFFFAFLPTSNLLTPIGTIFGERLSYAPSIGAVVALILLLKERWRSPFITVAIPLYIAFSWYYAACWKNNQTLFAHQMKASPQSIKTRVNYAVVLRNQGKFEEAKNLLNGAIETFPENAEALLNLALVALHEKNEVAAEEYLLSSHRINPSLPNTMQMLGRLKFNQGKYGDAKLWFEMALAANPNDVDTLVGFYALTRTVGDTKGADFLDRKITKLSPSNREFLTLKK